LGTLKRLAWCRKRAWLCQTRWPSYCEKQGRNNRSPPSAKAIPVASWSQIKADQDIAVEQIVGGNGGKGSFQFSCRKYLADGLRQHAVKILSYFRFSVAYPRIDPQTQAQWRARNRQ
jgi:hypothetical protein